MEKLNLEKPRNAAAYAERVQAFNKRPGPRVGDFCRMLDGSLRRFTYDWGKSIQVTSFATEGQGCNFYLCVGGADYSGGLDPGVEKEKLQATSELRPGRFWFFDENWPGANRGRWFDIDCRVYEEL